MHPATLAIIIGGARSNARAIVVRERALLPVRALSQALGRRVDYLSSLHEIDVHRSNGPTIHLRIGSRTAWIGPKRTRLDVAPLIVGGRTYAPLRFLADAMNVRVHYSAAQHAVLVPKSTTKTVALAAGISGLVPLPYSTNTTAFPVVGANINDPKVPASAIRLLLDGTDVTMLSQRTAHGILYLPKTPLAVGNHVAEISLDNGATIAERWAFTTTVAGVVASPEPAQAPLPNGQTFPEIQFYSLDGTTFSAGDATEVEMVAPAGGYAYVQACYNYWSYPLYPNPAAPQIYDGWVQLPYSGGTQFCPLQGYYVDARGVRYLAPYSIFVTIYGPNYYYGGDHHHDRGGQATPSPSPSPSPAPTNAPPIGRRTPPPGNCPPGRRCILGGTPAPLRPHFDGGVKRPITHPVVTHPVVTHPHFGGGVKRPIPHTPVRVPHVVHASHPSHASSSSHSSGSSHSSHHATPHPHPKATAAPARP